MCNKLKSLKWSASIIFFAYVGFKNILGNAGTNKIIAFTIEY